MPLCDGANDNRHHQRPEPPPPPNKVYASDELRINAVHCQWLLISIKLTCELRSTGHNFCEQLAWHKVMRGGMSGGHRLRAVQDCDNKLRAYTTTPPPISIIILEEGCSLTLAKSMWAKAATNCAGYVKGGRATHLVLCVIERAIFTAPRGAMFFEAVSNPMSKQAR